MTGHSLYFDMHYLSLKSSYQLLSADSYMLPIHLIFHMLFYVFYSDLFTIYYSYAVPFQA